ncbi:DUF1080 domain-containing protein [Spirosoma harenae]
MSFRFILFTSLLGCVAVADVQAQEKKDGWKRLFNGHDLSGWHAYGGKSIGAGWQVDQGALKLCVPDDIGRKAPTGGDLITDAVFSGDFEFKAEWKIDRFTNSGIFFFVQEEPQFKNMYQTGLEVQVLDDAIYEGLAENKHRAGDLFGIASANNRYLQPIGGWNKVHLMLKDNKLTISMNGYSIQEHDLSSVDWKKRIAESKLKDAPISKGRFSGRIGIQDWGSTVWFRNIKIRQL